MTTALSFERLSDKVAAHQRTAVMFVTFAASFLGALPISLIVLF